MEVGTLLDLFWDTLAEQITARRHFYREAQLVQDALIDLDRERPKASCGFAILAIDFLVMETLQGFREGVSEHFGQSRNLIVNFLKAWPPLRIYIPMGSTMDIYCYDQTPTHSLPIHAETADYPAGGHRRTHNTGCDRWPLQLQCSSNDEFNFRFES